MWRKLATVVKVKGTQWRIGIIINKAYEMNYYDILWSDNTIGIMVSGVMLEDVL